MSDCRCDSVGEAVSHALSLRDQGKYDWFRGQAMNWTVTPSIYRLSDKDRNEAIEKLKRFEMWARGTEGLETIAADVVQLIAIAQHYGIPTSFVDFTTRPEIAGFFAISTRKPEHTGDCAIICLNREEFVEDLEIYKEVMAEWKGVNVLTPDVSNLWRLQAQHGVFLEIPGKGIENQYPFDRILFPPEGRLEGLSEEDVYPENASPLEILLNQYFDVEISRETDAKAREMLREHAGTYVEWLPPSSNGLAKYFRSGLPAPLASWDADQIRRWLVVPEEEWTPVGTHVRRTIAISMAMSPTEIARAVASQVETSLAENDDLRQQIVNWVPQVEGPKGDLYAESLGSALNRLWQGLRLLPTTNEDIARGLGTCSALAKLYFGEDLTDGHREEALTCRYLPGAVCVGMAGTDGSGTYGWVAEADLRNAMRQDLAALIHPDHARILDRITSLVQILPWPNRTYEFGALARLFARQLAPSQVLRYQSGVIFFSPARLRTLM